MIKLKTETHTALLGADETLREARIGCNRVYCGNKPVYEIDFRVDSIRPRGNSSVTLGLRLPYTNKWAEHEAQSGIFEEGRIVSALVVEEGGAYKIVGLLAP